jgi:hypothetical protein
MDDVDIMYLAAIALVIILTLAVLLGAGHCA